jgi:hypothetical protein
MRMPVILIRRYYPRKPLLPGCGVGPSDEGANLFAKFSLATSVSLAM